MGLPKTYSEEEAIGTGQSGTSEWSALNGNTLVSLEDTLVERSWMYVRQKVGVRARDRLKRHKNQSEKTPWKPRICEVLVNPKDWGESLLRVSKFDVPGDRGLKQFLFLSNLKEVEKGYLPADEALQFPCARNLPPDAEYRYGHLLLTLNGVSKNGVPFYSEFACKYVFYYLH